MNNEQTFKESIKMMEELFGLPFKDIKPSFGNSLKLGFCWYKVENPKDKILFGNWLDEMESKPDELNELCYKAVKEFQKI